MDRKITIPCDGCSKWALRDDDIDPEENVCHRCDRFFCWECSKIVFSGIEKTLCHDSHNEDYYSYYHECNCCRGKLKCRVITTIYDYDKESYDKRCTDF